MEGMLLAIYPWVKALHLLAVIALYAGLMYLPRLFVYHHQAEPGGEAENYFMQMERRLFKGIMNPALVVVWICGLLMIAAQPSLLGHVWFIVKLIGVIAVTGIHRVEIGPSNDPIVPGTRINLVSANP